MKHEITFTLGKEEFLKAVTDAVLKANRYGVLYNIGGAAKDAYPVVDNGAWTGEYRVIWRTDDQEPVDEAPVTDTAEKVMS